MIDLGLTPVIKHDDSGCGGTSCTCGEADSEQIVLDARVIPHAIRHATIFGALNSLATGTSLDLIASHDPIPLRTQLEQQNPGSFSTDYVTSGPDEWVLRFTRL